MSDDEYTAWLAEVLAEAAERGVDLDEDDPLLPDCYTQGFDAAGTVDGFQEAR